MTAYKLSLAVLLVVVLVISNEMIFQNCVQYGVC
jgi:hypothetical protein